MGRKNLVDNLETPDEADQGFFVEVDLKYPQRLHDLHNDFSPAVEKLVPKKYMLPKRQAPTKKLLETLYDKKDYVCHYSILKFLVDQGMEISQLKRVLQFDQKNFMKPYVELKTSMRQRPGLSEFKKNFLKLLNNSCFGKTMENLRKRQTLITVSDHETAKFYCNKFNFNRFTIFKEDLIGVTLMKKSIKRNKLTYIGAAILGLSKLELYNFHFNKMIPMYKNRAQVLYKDTESLFYEVRTADLYYDMRSRKTDLDLSSYPKEHPLFTEANRKVPLKLTDELNGAIVAEAVFLKPKANSIAYVDGFSVKTKQSAKGVNHEVKKLFIMRNSNLFCLTD